MSSDQPALDAFHWLGFGMAAVDALREAAPIEASKGNVQIRRAGVGDQAAVDELLGGLQDHMSGPPIFWKHEREAVEDLLSGERGSLWLAYDRDQAVGLSGLVRDYEEGCAILQDEKTIEVEPAFVKAGWRGRGVGRALLNRCLEQAQQEDYSRVGVDFESANVWAVRFWTRWFEPVCYSLVRWVKRARVDCHTPIWGFTEETPGKSIPQQYSFNLLIWMNEYSEWTSFKLEIDILQYAHDPHPPGISRVNHSVDFDSLL